MGIHLGKLIKEEVYRQEISVSSFARKINRSRNVVYDIFERESIDTALLNKIVLVLNVDFFALFSQQKEYKRQLVQVPMLQDTSASGISLRERVEQLENLNKTLQKEIAQLKKSSQKG
jgi:transcriptional regulator with XRE-family HTH domain